MYDNKCGAAHIPVLADEAVTALCIRAGGIYIDATFGAGGHSKKILGKIGASGRLVAIDCDRQAERFAGAIDDPRFHFVHANFVQMREILSDLGIAAAGGVLMDLGFSSLQLADSSRGFSFSSDGPLDMRMDDEAGAPLRIWLRNVSERALGRALLEFGEERNWRRIAATIVSLRDAGKLASTADLANACLRAAGGRSARIHPATRTFQALRIVVNKELDRLALGLAAAGQVLESGGRFAAISFHSLEDRMIKRFLRPPDGNYGPLRACGKLVRPGPGEISANPRARSARMRVGVKQ